MATFFKKGEIISPSGAIVIDETCRRGKIIDSKRKDGICSWCGGEVIRPKRLWCSKECIEKYNLTQPNEIKKLVKKRDKRKCAVCGVFCPTKDLWDLDHIIEVSRGGHPFDLNNLQTLCINCHKKKTKKMYNKNRG